MARENGIHKIEVHVAGLIFDLESDEPRCLIAKRTASRALFPSLWECGGGQVKAGETFPDALLRQIHEEFGLEAEVLFPLGDYFIRTENGGIPGVKYVCGADGQAEIELDPQEHTEFAWITEKEIGNYSFIPGVEADVAEAFRVLDEC